MNATSNILDRTKNQIENITLADNYRSKGLTKNFNSHLDTLIETSIEITGEDKSVFKRSNVALTNSLYWQTEAHILEELDDVNDNGILNELDNLEDLLHNKIINKLGNNYDKSSIQNKMIDISVHNALMFVKFHYFSESDKYKNPWEDAKNILFDNCVLHTFSHNIQDFSDFGFKLNKKESEITKYNKIGILGKGNKKGYLTSYIRDLVSLRNTLFNLLDDCGHRSTNPIKTNDIISEIRKIGINEKELSNSNIVNWLISPLKRSNRIGSNKDGFFVIKDCEDLFVSYKSHYENFKGYYRTLEKHKDMSQKFTCSNGNFEEHLNIFGS